MKQLIWPQYLVEPQYVEGYLMTRLVVDIGNVADCRKLKTDKRFYVRQIGSVIIDVT